MINNNSEMKKRKIKKIMTNRNERKRNFSVSSLVTSNTIKIQKCKDKNILKKTCFLQILRKGDLKKNKIINVVSNIGWFTINYNGKEYLLKKFGNVLSSNHKIKIRNNTTVYVTYGKFSIFKTKLYKINAPIFIKGTLKVRKLIFNNEGESMDIDIDKMTDNFIDDDYNSNNFLSIINENNRHFESNVSILRESSVLMEESCNNLKPKERMQSVGKVKNFYTISPLTQKVYKKLYAPFVEEELIYENKGRNQRLYGAKTGNTYRLYKITHKYNNLFTKIKFNGIDIRTPLVDLSIEGSIKWKFKKIILGKFALMKYESFSF